MTRACLDGRPFRVTPNSLAAGGDFIGSEDAAVAMAALLTAPHLGYDAYNLASGRFIGIRELLDTFRTVAPAFRYEVVDDSRADANIDPTHRQACWNAYAIVRAGKRRLEAPLTGGATCELHGVGTRGSRLALPTPGVTHGRLAATTPSASATTPVESHTLSSALARLYSARSQTPL